MIIQGFPASRVIPLDPVRQRSTSPGRTLPELDRTQYRFGVQYYIIYMLSSNQHVNVLFMYIISYFKENFVDQTSCMSQILARPVTFTISEYIFITKKALNCYHGHFEPRERRVERQIQSCKTWTLNKEIEFWTNTWSYYDMMDGRRTTIKYHHSSL